MAENKSKDDSDFLDQGEIDKLLTQAAEAQQKKPVFGGGNTTSGEAKIDTYDFRNPTFLSEAELRRLRLLHEDFIRYLSARLSLFLRMELGIKMSKLTTVTFSKFCDSLPNPTHLTLFKVDPLSGVGVLDINPRLALTIADRLLGGRGHSVKAERYLTEIEVALIEDVIQIVLEEWCNQWKVDQELHPVTIGHENNGRFLQTSPKDSIILALSLEVNFGDCSEQLQIGLPYYTIEPVVKKMQTRKQRDNLVTNVQRKAEWHPSYDNILLPVHAEWNAFEVPIREISHLKVGDVLELSTTLFEDTKLVLNGSPKYIGTVGIHDDIVAVKLTSKLRTEKTSHDSN